MLEQEDTIKPMINVEDNSDQISSKPTKLAKNAGVVFGVLILLVLVGLMGYKYGNSQVKNTGVAEDNLINNPSSPAALAVNSMPNIPLNQVLSQYCETSDSVPLSVLPFELSSDIKAKYGLADKIPCRADGEMGGYVENSFYLQTESPGVGSLYFVSSNSNAEGNYGIPSFGAIAFPYNHLLSRDLTSRYSAAIAEALSQPIAEKTGVVITVSSGPGNCEVHFPLEVTAYGHKLSESGEAIATVFSRTYEVGNPYRMTEYKNFNTPTASDQISSLIDESLTDCPAEKMYADNVCYSNGQWTCGTDTPDSAGWAMSLRPGVNQEDFMLKLRTLISQLPIHAVLQEEVEATLEQITF